MSNFAGIAGRIQLNSRGGDLVAAKEGGCPEAPKAWLFSGSPRGAEASAMLYTLVETAKAAGLEPRAYLHYLFETLPTVTHPEGIQALLPHRLTPELLKVPTPQL